jgi:hypothetical protein
VAAFAPLKTAPNGRVIVKSKTLFFAAAALVIGGASVELRAANVARTSGCEAGDMIDGSTAAQAKAKIERAGFRQVRNLQKSCDNFWHGIAVKDGSESNIVLTPQGQALREGD